MFSPKEQPNSLSQLSFTLGLYFYPLLGHPVENVDSVKSFLIGSATPKDDHSVILGVVAHGAVRSLGGNISGRLDFCPLHGGGVEGPDIVHVYGF